MCGGGIGSVEAWDGFKVEHNMDETKAVLESLIVRVGCRGGLWSRYVLWAEVLDPQIERRGK